MFRGIEPANTTDFGSDRWSLSCPTDVADAVEAEPMEVGRHNVATRRLVIGNRNTNAKDTLADNQGVTVRPRPSLFPYDQEHIPTDWRTTHFEISHGDQKLSQFRSSCFERDDMSGFSIDLAADRIVDPRTRSYFEEVTKSFANGCYRSSLVMLWSVVVCDLVYKLQKLKDLYGDATAEVLLDDVEKKRVANPHSPDWEGYLLDEVAKRTKMLEVSEHIQLQNLQKLRHLSAHPVLTAADLLFQPTEEDVRAQIRLALEALLLKPPLFSKKMIGTLVADIGANRAQLISRDKLKAYIEARYLPNIPLAIELELFRTLWKFCFRLNNADAEANRRVNCDSLAILYARNGGAIRKMLADDRAAFSNIGPDIQPLDSLIEFLAEHPELHATLDSAAHVHVQARLDADVNNRAKATFRAGNFSTHLTLLGTETTSSLFKINDTVWTKLVADAGVEGCLEAAQQIAVKVYVESVSYNEADERFAKFIEPMLPKFTAASMTELLEGIEGNQQTYGRSRASFDHPQVKTAATALGVSTSSYRCFERAL